MMEQNANSACGLGNFQDRNLETRNRTAVISIFLLTALTGCGGAGNAPVTTTKPDGPGLALTGKAMDGQQPIAGAHVYLYAASTSGYGEPSTALLSSAGTGFADSNGGYVITASDGTFTIPSGYNCKSTDQIYAYVLGGNAGLGINSAIGELAAIGPCPLTASTTPSFVWINEVSTVAAAYAIAGFANDATHVSSSGTALALIDIANAFSAAANLATLSTGASLSIIPSGNATVPQSEINTLANILASCIHSASGTSSTCTALFTNTEAGNIAPTDTATAAINIAHSPANDVATLYALQTAAFSPALAAAPNDFSIALNFPTADLGGTNGIAVDGLGNVWITNGLYSLMTLSSTGSILSGSNGYTNGLYGPGFFAIDQSSNVWVGQYETVFNPPGPYSLFEFSSSGGLLSGSGYTGGGLDQDRGMAIDAVGNIWVANMAGTTSGGSISKFSSTGESLSGTSGFTGGGMNGPFNIALDVEGDVWVTNGANNTVVKLSNSGSILSGANGFTDGGVGDSAGIAIDSQSNVWVTYPNANTTKNRVTKFSSSGKVLSGSSGYSGAGVGNGPSLAIDGAGNVWIPNYYSNSITELSNSGTVLSGSNGYATTALFFPYTIVTDGSGNVWVNSGDIIGSCNLVEYIGIAAPVVTPLSVGVKNNTLGTRP